jgi:CheY-like chemotaxis protein
VNPAKTALVVDDSELYAYFARAVLEQLGYRVEVATNVAQALSVAEAIDPSVVCIDYRLGPTEKGDVLCRRLRTVRYASAAPAIVLMSAEADHRDAAGADAFVEKSMDPQALMAAVRRAVASRL